MGHISFGVLKPSGKMIKAAWLFSVQRRSYIENFKIPYPLLLGIAGEVHVLFPKSFMRKW